MYITFSRYFFTISKNEHYGLFLLYNKSSLFALFCFAMLFNTPIALINTIREELPTLINGKGKPAIGIEPVKTCYCTEK